MFKFNSDIYSFDKNNVCSSGSGVLRSFELDPNDSFHLLSKEINLEELIESYRAQCSIERIILSHGLGDELVLNTKVGVYLDKEQVEDLSNSFSFQNINSKMAEVYKKTDTTLSFDEFCNAVASGDFNKIANSKKVVDNGGLNNES